VLFRSVEQVMQQIHECLNDLNNDWEKRVDSLRRIRSLAIACQGQYDEEFMASIKLLNTSMPNQIKDLRSQIVREACISVAFMSTLLRNRMDHFAEIVLNPLISVLQNSAKVITTSGLVAIRFIIENTHSGRLIPLVTSTLTSKSKEIRRYAYEFINQVLTVWDKCHLEKNAANLAISIKKGITDADQEGRVYARKAFWSFHAHFPSQANNMLESLDLRSQKLLQSGANGNFGSMRSLKDASISQDLKAKVTATPTVAASPHLHRSTSAADMKNSRSQSVKSSTRIPLPDNLNSSTLNRNAASRIPSISSATPKVSRVAISQPGSRSTSPTPKNAYITHTNNAFTSMLNNQTNMSLIQNGNYSLIGSPPGQSSITLTNGNTTLLNSTQLTPNKSKIPTSSRNSSRESSPGRRASFGSSNRMRPAVTMTPGRRFINEQSISSAVNRYNKTRRWDGLDSDEASETSSICSERSYASSLGGTRIIELRDFSEATNCLTSNQWSSRRDGILSLMQMMQTGRQFNRAEIKRLTDLFSRLFADPHGKVFALFLDTLCEFIRVYSRDLHEWLYVLLTRLLTKLGSESLTSIYQKICRCLESVRTSFDLDVQFNILIQFINDNTQSPNLKVKVAVLKYLQDIICLMEPQDFHATNDIKCAVSRIISLTAEPKSVEIRKTAQTVLVALFNLNTPVFSMLLTELPKRLQEPATRILQNHVKNFSQETPSSNEFKIKSPTNYYSEFLDGSQLSHVIKDIQSLNFKEAHKEITSKDSGIHSNNDLDSGKSNESLDSRKIFDAYDPNVYSDFEIIAASHTGSSSMNNNTMQSNYNNMSFKNIFSVLETMTSASSTKDELCRAMEDLVVLIKVDNKNESKWTENFNNILLSLFEHINNKNSIVQINALLAMKELLTFQSKEFSNYVELTIIKLIEQYKDITSDLGKIVEEVICTAARYLPLEPCVHVLKPIIEKADYPKNFIAIRMLQKCIEKMDSDTCLKLILEMRAALMIAWDSPHSPVRKAVVFCLVGVYMIIGDTLKAYLTDISSSKQKLLNVYINRAKEQSTNQN